MHLKQKEYYFGVLVIYTITTITLTSIGCCEPTTYSSQPNSHSAPHNDRESDLTTKNPAHPFNREDRRRQKLDSVRQEEESRTSRVFDGIQFDQRLGHRMASSLSDKRKQTEEEWMYSSLFPPNEDCGAGEIKHVINGKFYINGQLEVGFQSDSAVPGKQKAFLRIPVYGSCIV